MGAVLFQITTQTHLIIFILTLFSFSHWFVGHIKECISGVVFLSKHLFYVYRCLACMNAHAQAFWRLCPRHQPPNPATSLLYTKFMPLALSWVWPKTSFLSKWHQSSKRPMVCIWPISGSCIWPISGSWQYQKIEPDSQWDFILSAMKHP